jgi:hypothetical protein
VAIPVGDVAGPPGWAVYAAVTGEEFKAIVDSVMSGVA